MSSINIDIIFRHPNTCRRSPWTIRCTGGTVHKWLSGCCCLHCCRQILTFGGDKILALRSSAQPRNAADVIEFGWIDGWMNGYGRKDSYWLLTAGIRVDALWRRGVMLRAGPCLLPRYLPSARLARAPT